MCIRIESYIQCARQIFYRSKQFILWAEERLHRCCSIWFEPQRLIDILSEKRKGILDTCVWDGARKYYSMFPFSLILHALLIRSTWESEIFRAQNWDICFECSERSLTPCLLFIFCPCSGLGSLLLLYNNTIQNLVAGLENLCHDGHSWLAPCCLASEPGRLKAKA